MPLYTHHTRVAYLAKIMAAREMHARYARIGVHIPQANWRFARELYRGWLMGIIRASAPCPIPEPTVGA
jgi:hypothetical protein